MKLEKLVDRGDGEMLERTCEYQASLAFTGCVFPVVLAVDIRMCVTTVQLSIA